MILCVTLNPCLDKTLTVRPWRPGDLVRGTGGARSRRREREQCRSGPLEAGAEAAARHVLGRHGRHALPSPAGSDDGLDPIVVPTESPTRVILTVRTESTPSRPRSSTRIRRFRLLRRKHWPVCVEGLLADEQVEALCLSGSSPAAGDARAL